MTLPATLEDARDALAAIQVFSIRFLNVVEALPGPDDAAQIDAVCRDVLTTVRILDSFLTGRADGSGLFPRPDDGTDMDALRGGEAWFHLSDGGYSRLVVDLSRGTVGIDQSLSLPRVRDAWKTLIATR